MTLKPQLTISQKGVLLVCVPLVFQLLFFADFAWLLQQSKVEAAAASRSREIIAENDRLLKSMYFSGTALAAFALDKSGQMESNYRKSEEMTLECFDHLMALVSDDPEEVAILKKLKPKIDKMLSILKTTHESLGDSISAFAFVKTHRLTKRMQGLIEEIVEMSEQISAREREKRTDLRAKRAEFNVQMMLAAGVAFDIVLALGLAIVITRRITDRLRVLSENTVRMSRKEPLLPRMEGNDEIAVLDDSFHDMATAVAEAEKQKQEFVAMIGHDLGAPLTLIHSTLHELSTQEDMDSARTKLPALEDELRRLMGLIRDLLDASKMEAGKFIVHPETVYMWPIIQRAVSAIEPAAKGKDIKINTRVSDDLEVLADEDRIVQVLINLLSNALKFAPEASAITVSCEQKDAVAEVRVHDSGPGIKPEDQKLIFERFFQSGEQDTKKKGTGLGLAISKAIIEAHSGAIAVTSMPGDTTFCFTLPVAASTIARTTNELELEPIQEHVGNTLETNVL